MIAFVKNKLSVLRRNYRARHVFRGKNIILHFSYHKCLTVYYGQILGRLAAEHGFFFRHYSANRTEFDVDVKRSGAAGIFSIHAPNPVDLREYPDLSF